MAKIQIKSEKLTPFGGIFSIMEQFDALLAQTIDSTLGLRCTMFGYQYSEILRSLMCVYLCGGSWSCFSFREWKTERTGTCQRKTARRGFKTEHQY